MPEQPTIAAVISVNDMYHELQAVRTDIATLNSKFDTMPLQVSQLTSLVTDHETRLRTREAMRLVTWAQLLAVMMLIITGFGVVAAFLAIGH